MSKSLQNNNLSCSKCCASKSLQNTALSSGVITSQTLADFIAKTTQSTSQPRVLLEDGIIDNLTINNLLKVLGSAEINTIITNSLTIGAGALVFDNTGTITGSGNITLSPNNPSECEGEVTITSNLTVNGCYTNLCTTDLYIKDSVPTLGICNSIDEPVDNNDDLGFELKYIVPSSTTNYTGFFGFDKNRMNAYGPRWVFWYDTVKNINVSDDSTDQNFYRNSSGTLANGVEADILYTYLIKNPDNPEAPSNLLGNDKNDIKIQALSGYIYTESSNQLHEITNNLSYEVGLTELHTIGTAGGGNDGRFKVIDNDNTCNLIELSNRVDGNGKGLFLYHMTNVDIKTCDTNGNVSITSGASGCVNISPILCVDKIKGLTGSTITITSDIQICDSPTSKTLKVDNIYECLTNMSIGTVSGTRDVNMISTRDINMDATRNLTIDTTNGYIQTISKGFQAKNYTLSNITPLISNVGTLIESDNGRDINLNSNAGSILLYSTTGKTRIDSDEVYIWGGSNVDIKTFDSSGPINIETSGTTSPIFITTNAATSDIKLETITSGDISLISVDDIILTAIGSTIDMDSAIYTLDVTTSATITANTGLITLQTILSGDITITSASDILATASGISGIRIASLNSAPTAFLELESRGSRNIALVNGITDVGIYLHTLNNHDIALQSSEDIEIQGNNIIFLDTLLLGPKSGYIQSSSRGYYDDIVNAPFNGTNYEIGTIIRSLNNHDIYINAKSTLTGDGTFVVNPGVEFKVQPVTISSQIPINPGRIPQTTIYFSGPDQVPPGGPVISPPPTIGLRTRWRSGSGIDEKLYVLSDVDRPGAVAFPIPYDGWVSVYKGNSGHLIEPTSTMIITGTTVTINGSLIAPGINDICASGLVFDSDDVVGTGTYKCYDTDKTQIISPLDNFRMIYLSAVTDQIRIGDNYTGPGDMYLNCDGISVQWRTLPPPPAFTLQTIYNNEVATPADIVLNNVIQQVRISHDGAYSNGNVIFEAVDNSATPNPYFQIVKASATSGTITIGNNTAPKLEVNTTIDNGTLKIVNVNTGGTNALDIENNTGTSMVTVKTVSGDSPTMFIRPTNTTAGILALEIEDGSGNTIFTVDPNQTGAGKHVTITGNLDVTGSIDPTSINMQGTSVYPTTLPTQANDNIYLWVTENSGSIPANYSANTLFMRKETSTNDYPVITGPIPSATSALNKLSKFDTVEGESITYSGITVDGSNNISGINDLTITGDLTLTDGNVSVTSPIGINNLALVIKANGGSNIFEVYPNRTGANKHVVITGNLDVTGSIDPTSINMQGTSAYPTTLPTQANDNIYLWVTENSGSIPANYSANTLFMRKETSTNDYPVITGPIPSATSALNKITKFDTANGESITYSGITVDGSNNISGINDLTITGDLSLTNGNITIINEAIANNIALDIKNSSSVSILQVKTESGDTPTVYIRPTDVALTSSALDIKNSGGTTIFQVTPNQTVAGKHVTITGNLDVTGSIDPTSINMQGTSAYPTTLPTQAIDNIYLWDTNSTPPMNYAAHTLFMRKGTSGNDYPVITGPMAPVTSASTKIAKFDTANGESITYTGITVDVSDNVSGINDLTMSGDLTLTDGNISVTSPIGTDNLALVVKANGGTNIFEVYPNRTGANKHVVITGNLDVTGSIDPTSINMQGTSTYPTTLPTQAIDNIYLWDTNSTPVSSDYATHTLFMRKGVNTTDYPIITGPAPSTTLSTDKIAKFNTTKGESITYSEVTVTGTNNNVLTYGNSVGKIETASNIDLSVASDTEIVYITGTLTADRTITLPTVVNGQKLYVIIDPTFGAFNVTINTTVPTTSSITARTAMTIVGVGSSWYKVSTQT
ncbi:hypothetical protein QKU48_gp0547 [Fadolivirus algeromassiliense]|jgi:hypothetical protein|uniref:Uncharacterized protein n=1 Tax=Fadolivirus FV1/VV64 TaxID=3070911 RepID=A0A7D3QUB3_9VIRU|nr:hypothetical protein QKU48_gp0547 [Fadolivirus algeromassiliense]QKF94005.1 hypothetical protein Fadolivirus_1_547 [Fadolivirus FV1/VV64]